jgi:hypothetical protein
MHVVWRWNYLSVQNYCGGPPLVGCMRLLIQYVRVRAISEGRLLHPKPKYKVMRLSSSYYNLN